jgi:hypothetical protein
MEMESIHNKLPVCVGRGMCKQPAELHDLQMLSLRQKQVSLRIPFLLSDVLIDSNIYTRRV